MRVLFTDSVCYKPYSFDSLLKEPLGGSEATLLRVAQALSVAGVETALEQPAFGPKASGDFTHVINMRSYHHLPELRERFPQAKLYTWLHDVQPVSALQAVPLLDALKCDVICVSDWHSTQTKEIFLAGHEYQGQFKVHRIYNPIDDALVPDGTEHDPYKLIYTSSPHKGLEDTLQCFARLHDLDPKFKLFVANPGYVKTENLNQVGVVALGALPHNDVIAQVRSSLCLFQLNHNWSETFGLVYAEAQAVGTPFLTDRKAAIHELSDHPGQFVDTTDYKAVIEKVFHWSKRDRPRVRLPVQFRTKKIVKEWLNLLEKSHEQD